MTRPLRSARITRPHRYYSRSAPVLRNGTQPLAAFTTRSLPLAPAETIPMTDTISGRQVPAFRPEPSQAHATYTPDTAWAVNRYPPDSSQRQDQPSVSMHLELSTLHQWFA